MDYKINVVIDNGNTTEAKYTVNATIELLKQHGFEDSIKIVNNVLRGCSFLFHTDSEGFERIHLSVI